MCYVCELKSEIRESCNKYNYFSRDLDHVLGYLYCECPLEYCNDIIGDCMCSTGHTVREDQKDYDKAQYCEICPCTFEKYYGYDRKKFETYLTNVKKRLKKDGTKIKDLRE